MPSRNYLPALYIGLAAFALRAVLNLGFFLRYGWFASNLIEIWFYYGVAKGVFSLSPLDPTRWLLRILGLLIHSGILYQAVAFSGALISALTASLLFLWAVRWYDRPTGLRSGAVFALLPAPITLCLANFSHDIVQLPMIVLFWLALAAALKGGCGRIKFAGAFAALLAAILGFTVGPIMAAAVISLGFYFLWELFRKLFDKDPPWPALAAFAVGLLLANAGLYLLMKAYLLEKVMVPLALRFRGIDLAAQMEITVGDLQPLPPESLWNRYNLFLFFIPWGLWVALRKRDFFLLSVFGFGLALALAVNRGTRLLDLVFATLVGLGWANWSPSARRLTVGFLTVMVGLNLLLPAASSALRLEMVGESVIQTIKESPRLLSECVRVPPARPRLYVAGLVVGFVLLGLFWTFRLARGGRRAWLLPAVLTLLAESGWVMVSTSPSSEQVEYEAYRWLDGHSLPGEKIFAAWNQGFFIPAVTRLKPITTPDRIDIELTGTYWREEREAVAELARRGVKYVHVCTRYFGVTAVDPSQDIFSMRGNTIIGPRPDHIRRFSRLRRTFLYRLIYEPATLNLLQLYDRFDPDRGIGVRIYELK